MDFLLKNIKNCTICEKHLTNGVRPVVTASKTSKIVIIGQAPGTKVHASGIRWDDKSGENLREWMGVSSVQFYDTRQIAIMPMGFCYPGKGKSGDLPPRPECAPQWHSKLLGEIENPELILLIGKYAQDYYLGNQTKSTLTETVRNYRSYLPKYFVLPHPSPRNNIWQAKNEWFRHEIIPELRFLVKKLLF